MEMNIFYILGFLLVIYFIYKYHNERKEKMRWEYLSEEQKNKELHDSIGEKSKQGLRDVLNQSKKTDTIKEQITKEINIKNKIDKTKNSPKYMRQVF